MAEKRKKGSCIVPQQELEDDRQEGQKKEKGRGSKEGQRGLVLRVYEVKEAA